ncbi:MULTISPECIES: cobaltochelatase subunit CobN [Methanobacterium]|uniref:CobN/magnesium chelatase domain-containing protein n=1 Tax=Methanobacterium bryantii TaxID=2161 RepID=A0A2A2H5J7_METBR|nr:MULTISPECIES: cobaltochelatase subunit CobN [Methanobacterium]PAV04721.1 hypothetical protein ASJ80_10410 [Methanobacterium bryantii]
MKILLLMAVLLFSFALCGTVSADNITGNQSLNTTNNSTLSSGIYSAYSTSQSTVSKLNISGTVRDAYDKSKKEYAGEYNDAVPVSNATVNLRNQSNKKIIKTVVTGNSGTYTFSNLTKGSYIVEILYKTYKSFTKSITLTTTPLTVNHTFVPDIAVISYSGTSSTDGQLNKMQTLQNLSCRVYTIESYSKDDSKWWMLKYTNFIMVDMYSYNFAIPADVIADSPANQNHRIAYVFGIYDANFISKYIGSWNFLGGTDKNNTYNTLENTYIGSYWQAEAVNDSSIVKENMQNMLDYIFYLMGETSVNPTKIEGRTPLLSNPTWGIYHPDYGIFGSSPTQKEINEWIKADPGYNSDKSGSLNWMTNELKTWQAKHNTNKEIYAAFEKWYNSSKSKIKGSFIIIASYNPGGALVDKMIKTYEAQGRAVFNLFQSALTPSISQLLNELTVGVNGTGPLSRGVVCVTSLYSWSMDYANMADGGAIDDFAEMNIEIIKAVNGISNYSYTSAYGPQAEWTYAVTIPEFEGVFGAVPVSYIDSNGNEIPVQEGIDKVVQLTNGWANLKEKANKDKKVAIVLYDYPPGKSNIGASYLDVFQSLHDLLVAMYDEGYNIGMKRSEIPSATKLYTIIASFGNKGTWAQGLLNEYVEDNYANLTANKQLVNLTQYIKWFNELPETLQDQLVAEWGSGIGKVMVYDNKYLVIPGIVCGNVFITVQPSRGWEELETAEDYHSATLPPHQQYVAFYKWLSEVFKADVMINFGTHGTLEWLPGRSIGVQADDWTFQLSTIPDIYPFITSDPGEGMVAKDRAFALVISHMTPATVSSELYGDYVTLQNYITAYKNALKVNATDLVTQYQIKIKNVAVNDLGLDGPKTGESFETWVNSLDGYLDELQNNLITLGLHILGKGLTGDDLIQETVTIASSRTKVMDNIKKLLYPSLSVDYYTMTHNTAYDEKVTTIKSKLTYYITQLVNGVSLANLAAKNGISKQSDLYANLEFCVETISELSNNTEIESIITALSGGYIVPGLAGDPSYCDSLPTGTSMYSVDSTKMPSEAAWESAKNIVNKQIVEYYEEHKKFPDTIAIVMWGTELLRTEGVAIAQFLYYLGVEPVWDASGTVTGIKLMKLSELTITLSNGTVIHRPRIDVFATAVTSNVNWLKLMTGAVALVNATNESTKDNYVKKHYAQNPSLDRIFGLPGAVLEGTGVSDYLPNTGKWEHSADVTKELAEIYLSRISNAWTVDKNGNIVVSSNRDTFEYLLKNTDLITQNIDSTWGLLDSSDYYDWLGGVTLASQYLGANPDTSIVDIRNKNDIITRSLSEEINLEIRSTLLNPKYVNALLNQGASGWLEYSARIENLAAFDLINKDTNGGKLVSDSTWNQLANTLLSSAFSVNADYKAFSFQSMAGWLITAYRKGLWNADSKTITDLVDTYIKSTSYGVTCCHHTCANIDFSNFLMMSSSLSTAQLKQFADMMYKATGQVLSENSNGENSQNSGKGQSDTGKGSGSVGSSGSGVGSVGAAAVTAATKSASSSSSSASVASGSNNAYEVSTAASSGASGSSGVPVMAIIGVISILCLLGAGYFKSDILNLLKRSKN